MISIRVSALIVLGLAGCQRAEPVTVSGVEDICVYRMSGGVCHVSPTQLLTAPEKMAGREVVVVLYYPASGPACCSPQEVVPSLAAYRCVEHPM